MNKEMTKREALERSIKHWEEDYPGGVDWANFRFEEGMRPDHNNCALCLKYNGSFNGQGCSDCPLNNAGKVVWKMIPFMSVPLRPSGKGM